MSHWRFPVLKNDKVNDLISSYRTSLRVEVYDGSPHLQIKLVKKELTYFETIGRVRKDLFQKLDMVLMDTQPDAVNVAWYKFKVAPSPSTSKLKEYETIFNMAKT